MLRVFITRVQGAELDRDAVAPTRVHGRPGIRPRCNGFNGVAVTFKIALCVVLRAGAFTQHVIAEGQLLLRLPRSVSHLLRLVNGLAQYELLAQQGHCPQGGGHYGAGTQRGQQAGLAGRAGGGAGFGQKMFAQANRGG